MAILEFQKPEKVIVLEADNRFGKFEFKPLEPGYGITVGNALRRVLLSSLEGFAISSIRIDGVQHEFDTIAGVHEDVTNIILNLKKVRLKQIVPEHDDETVSVTVSGRDTFTAGDISKALSNFRVLNPELVICHLDPSTSFTLLLTINKGRGWVPAEENRHADDELSVIAIDSIYTPILNVKYTVENTRVDQKTDYDKLTLEITTDGSIRPQEALREAAKILIHHFALFTDEKMDIEVKAPVSAADIDEDGMHMRQLLQTPLNELDLSVRALNCLKSADVETLADLVKYQKTDLLKFRNFGKKSLDELNELLDHLNLTFGMDITKYNLDKE